jgi:exonuclease-1
LDFGGWDYELFLSLCVLSGCDFLDNIRGLGIKKMYNILNKHRDVNAVFAELRTNDKVKGLIAEGYETEWRKARMIFKHALVWDPHDGRLRHLTPVPDNCEFADDLSFLGPKFDDDEAKRIAEGEVNPITRQKFKVESPPRRTVKKATLKIGERRGNAPKGTSAQRSFMMNFFTKTFSPKKRPVIQAPTFEDDELDDDALATFVVDAVPNPKVDEDANAVDGPDVLKIDLIDDDDVTMKLTDGDAVKKDVFARSSPPRRKNFLSSMFSPGRAKKSRPSA